MVTLRLACKKDAFELARVHKICAKSQKDGFFHKLGILFIWQYYRIALSNRYSVILIAEDDTGCLGFHSGTLKAEEHLSSLGKNKIILFLCLIPQILIKPSLLKDILNRYRFTSNRNSDLEFGVKEGPRGEYWGWNPNSPNPSKSLELHKRWHLIMKDLNVNSVRSEVDLSNKRIFKSIEVMGGTIVNKINLSDGRTRAIVQYDISNWK